MTGNETGNVTSNVTSNAPAFVIASAEILAARVNILHARALSRERLLIRRHRYDLSEKGLERYRRYMDTDKGRDRVQKYRNSFNGQFVLEMARCRNRIAVTRARITQLDAELEELSS